LRKVAYFGGFFIKIQFYKKIKTIELNNLFKE